MMGKSSLALEAYKSSEGGLSNMAAVQYDVSAGDFAGTLPPALCVSGDVDCRALFTTLAPARKIWKPFEFSSIRPTSGLKLSAQLAKNYSRMQGGRCKTSWSI